MGRAVALVLIVLLALAVVRAALRRAARPPAPSRRAALATVRCAHCGVFVPHGQTLEVRGARYCGERCARAAGDGG